jgi:hypothetical protein
VADGGWAMRLLLAVLGAFAILLFSARAFPCDTDATATPESTCVEQARNGKPGAWLGIPTLRDLVNAKNALGHAQEAEQAAKQLADMQALRAEAYRKADENDQAASKAAQAEARRQADERAKAEAELHAWYRNPWLWGALGVGVGGFIVWELKR